MKKTNKVICGILSIVMLVSVALFAVSAETIVTTVKNIVDKWFVNGVEVTEEQFENAMQIKYEDYIIEHHLNTGIQYKINGVEVTEQEALEYMESAGKTFKEDENNNKPVISTLTFTNEDLTGLNAGSLGDYLTFQTDVFNNIIGVKVKSNKVGSITYKYNEDTYITHTVKGEDNCYYFVDSGYGVVYRDINEEDMTFKYGQANATPFKVCDENYEFEMDVEVGDYVYKFESTNHTITFNEVFESITLNIVE